MKFFHGLIWTLLQGCWALEGPQRLTAPLGGSVNVLCRYGKGNEESAKFWCKEESFRFCSRNHSVYTTGSETEVKRNRISIKDSHTSRIFRVTMDNLTQGDTGAYLCGVQRTRYDIWHPVDIVITSDAAASTDFPSILETATEEKPTSSTITLERIQPSNTQFLLLVVKIPLFLALIAVVAWVHICYKKGRTCSARIPEVHEEI